ncbi:MAG: hypothetical protein M3Q07_06085 [Pseudobdellovibrionaceae bacterium]|nr:hypothetical protein [Pseudobdellovibrionaceae bacterium]
MLNFRRLPTLAGSIAVALSALSSSMPMAYAETTHGLPGEMLVFARPSGAFYLGHVGWGYQTHRFPSRYCVGAVENPGGQAVVAAQADIGYWQRCNLDYYEMLQEMRNRGYVAGEWFAVGRSYPLQAATFANGVVRTRGYKVTGLNCANATWDIAREYGVSSDNLPLLQLLPAPNLWYAALSMGFGWQPEAM